MCSAPTAGLAPSRSPSSPSSAATLLVTSSAIKKTRHAVLISFILPSAAYTCLIYCGYDNSQGKNVGPVQQRIQNDVVTAFT